MDFFKRIFDAEEAFELEFDEGVLVNSADLAPLIKWENCESDDEPERGIEGSYSHSTYVWRCENPECALCGRRSGELQDGGVQYNGRSANPGKEE